MCPSLGPGSRTSRGAGSTFPGTGTLGTAHALSSGPRPLREVDASAPSSPRAPVLPSGGLERAPSLAPRSLFLGLSLRDPGGPRVRASSGNRLPERSDLRPPPIPLVLGGALRPGPLPLPSLLPPLPRQPRPREAPELPFRTRNPPNLGWTPFCRALPPASPRRLWSCNLEAQLSTSGDFSLLASPQAKFPERSRGLRVFTTAPGVRTRGASAAAARR